jgi:hypothetical protein
MLKVSSTGTAVADKRTKAAISLFSTVEIPTIIAPTKNTAATAAVT